MTGAFTVTEILPRKLEKILATSSFRGARPFAREPGIQRLLGTAPRNIEIPGSSPSIRALRGPAGAAPE
jgi:hypothetical protein